MVPDRDGSSTMWRLTFANAEPLPLPRRRDPVIGGDRAEPVAAAVDRPGLPFGGAEGAGSMAVAVPPGTEPDTDPSPAIGRTDLFHQRTEPLGNDLFHHPPSN